MGGRSGRLVWASDAYMLTCFGYICSKKKPPLCIGKLLTLYSGAVDSVQGHYSLLYIFPACTIPISHNLLVGRKRLIKSLFFIWE